MPEPNDKILQHWRTVNDALRVVAMDYFMAVTKGELPNHFVFNVVGDRKNISDNLEDISQIAAITIPIPDGATIEILSNSADDATDGSGVRTVDLHGLDNNGDIQVAEDIALNGTTPVILTGLNWKRVNSLHAKTVGSFGAVAAGNIEARESVAGSTFIMIEAGGNQSLQAHYTVPAGFNGFIPIWSMGSSANKTITALLRATSDWDSATNHEGVFLFKGIMQNQSTESVNPKPMALKFPPLCDIKISARADSPGGGDCSAEFQIMIEPV